MSFKFTKLCKLFKLDLKIEKNFYTKLFAITFFIVFALVDLIIRFFLPKQFIIFHKFGPIKLILFFLAYFSIIFLAIFKKDIRFFLILLLLAAFPNFLELLIFKGVSDYFYFVFFYNNISDILVFLALFLIFLKINCKKEII